jgi:hypothetical protein
MYRQQNIDFVLVYLPFSVRSISSEDPPTDRLAAILLKTVQLSYGTDIWK